ncbi:MAG: tRNA pseudouridine(55) synthase TruB [Bacilli bacterium]|nr:tRNA pseudouridine(55) synthase TruB [Bacilli bacterium]
MRHGIIFVRKEKDMTSYDVIRSLKHKLGIRKIGHAGTLDPFATGLLIIGVNEGTKVLPYLENESKEYIAQLTLGEMRDTYDVTGKVIKKKKVKKHTFEEINQALHSFVGVIKQTPPIYSAIKVKGKPLYQYARENKEVQLKTREQTIYDVRLMAYEKHKIYFYVKCNKGTYIRSLGVDLAKKLGEVGYLSNLERIAIGPYKIANVKKIKDISLNSIIDLKDALKITKITYQKEKEIKNGAPIKLNCTDDLVLIINKNKALALYELNKADMLYYCKRGFHYENISD